jgi:hypothetical protein
VCQGGAPLGEPSRILLALSTHNMTNRTLLFLIGLCLVGADVGKLLTHTFASADTGHLLLTWDMGLGQLLGLVLLVQNGTILGTIYANTILLLGGLLLVGIFFKILHWVGVDPLLECALAGIALTYSSWFIRKKPKGQLDILKLLFVLAACGSALLLLLHLAPREATYVAPALLWLAVLDYMYLDSSKRKLVK